MINSKQLNELIYRVFESLEKNNFGSLGKADQPMWERPLIGVAEGNDPYFDFLKGHIGDFHWNPKDIFQLKYPQEPDQPEIESRNLRLISMAFPQTMETKESQIKEHQCPSKNWIVSRGEWEPLMQEFSGKLVAALEEMGVRAVSIDLQPQFSRMTSGNLGIASTWSHRHGAYAAGLGTFGLSEGLITEKGKAMRISTLVIEAEVDKTTREYQSHHEWCLFYQDGSCGLCINRCPVSAISEEGHDKELCANYEDLVEANYWPKDLQRGDYIFGCGLCQVDIPCQNKRP